MVSYLNETKSGTKLKPLYIYGKNEFSIIADSITDSYKKLWELINLDRLTKIPNRFFLEKEFAKHKKHIYKAKFLALLDLDNFKELNDFFGHDFGDQVLIEFAERLKSASEGYNYVYGKLGGDEFILFGCEEDISKIERNIRDILKRVSGYYNIKTVSFYLTMSVGISIRDKENNADFYSMLKEADIALYKVKEKGKNKYYILSKEKREEEERKKRLYSELTLATENREIFMVYQPIVDYRTGQIVSYESLVRWNSKTFGLVSPGDFIPYLETTGEIIKVGKYILEEITDTITLINKPIHVNVSSKQLFEKDFADFVNNLLNKKGINPNMLYIEITETQELPKDPVVFENLSKLSNFGIRTSLDDFGTGYSNLYTISQIKPKSIKIDIFLIRNIDKDITSLNIVKAIKNMADSIGIEAIAEGVETKQIADILNEYGIYIMQGYYFSKPLKLEEILEVR
ncbi:MAG: bifunctional diguanylate cyclase/phosphodiesterase [Hydrogenothermaceae bacterium]